MYYFYVLYSLKDGKLYKGSTGQLLKRIEQHNNGQTKSTQKRRPLILLYYETYDNKKEAIRREYWSKTLEGGTALREILVEKSLLTEQGILNDQSIE
jgi:putative endonuclease